MGNDLSIVLLSFGEFGGGVQYFAHLSNALSKRTELTILSNESAEFRDLLDDSTCSEYITYTKREMSHPYFPLKIREELKRINPDVIHLPNYTGGKVGILIKILLPVIRTLGIPIVGTLHDPKSHSGAEFEFRGKDISGILRQKFSTFLDAVIVHGRESKRQALDMGYKESQTYIVPHGLYTHFATQTEDKPPDTEADILVFGHIRENKGYDRLPEILSLVHDEFEDTNILVAGSLAQNDSWGKRTLAKLRAVKNIELRQGYIPTNEVGNYFRGVEHTLLPYYDASSSGALMTSYVFDTPVVTTDVGDIGQYVRQDGSGIVATPNTNEAIAEAIIEMNSKRKRERYTKNIKSCKERYHWENITQRILSIYISLIDSG